MKIFKIATVRYEEDDTYISIGHSHEEEESGDVVLWIINKDGSLEKTKVDKEKKIDGHSSWDRWDMLPKPIAAGRFVISKSIASATVLPEFFRISADLPKKIQPWIDSILKEEFGQNIKIYWF